MTERIPQLFLAARRKEFEQEVAEDAEIRAVWRFTFAAGILRSIRFHFDGGQLSFFVRPMTRPVIPDAVIRNAWANRSRRCPQCGTEFVSKRIRRGCPKCRHVFSPYDVYGPPPDLDGGALWKEAAIVSDETSNWIMSLLRERAFKLPERPENFDNPRLTDLLRHEREMWEFEYQLMPDALDAGGELWWWSTPPGDPELLASRCGLAVVKDGRVTAVKMTAMS